LIRRGVVAKSCSRPVQHAGTCAFGFILTREEPGKWVAWSAHERGREGHKGHGDRVGRPLWCHSELSLSAAPVLQVLRGEGGARSATSVTAFLGPPLHRRSSSVVRRKGAGSVTKSRPPQVPNGDKNLVHSGALVFMRCEHPMPANFRQYRGQTNNPLVRRERAQYIESLAERHAQRCGLPLKSARRHIEQIAIFARSTVAARDEN
jgi:hypothetical protein